MLHFSSQFLLFSSVSKGVIEMGVGITVVIVALTASPKRTGGHTPAKSITASLTVTIALVEKACAAAAVAASNLPQLSQQFLSGQEPGNKEMQCV
jgi:hypothetical protein